MPVHEIPGSPKHFNTGVTGQRQDLRPTKAGQPHRVDFVPILLLPLVHRYANGGDELRHSGDRDDERAQADTDGLRRRAVHLV